METTVEEDELARVLQLSREKELAARCQLSAVQDSFRLRSTQRARLLAIYLIDDLGELKSDELKKLLSGWEKAPHFLFRENESDEVITAFLIKQLRALQSDPAYFKSIKRFTLPLCHKGAEKLVRETLQLPASAPLTEASVRRAVLASSLTFLRQNVGSCFATAPAILIQMEQRENFLNDLFELLTTGKLNRTFGGVEHMVPLSLSSGMGDLKKKIGGEIWLSPGLLAAAEAGDLIEVSLSEKEKIAQLERILLPFLEKGDEITVEDFLRKSLLMRFGLKPSDLEMCQKIELAQIASQRKLGSGYFGEAPSQKMALYAHFREKEEAARTAFKGLVDNALLKAWEFTLASFSEIKMEFSRWNLHTSLGLHHAEKDGIGNIIYTYIHEKLEENNQKMLAFQNEYQAAFDQLKTLEALLRQAGTESEVRRLQTEHRSRLYHFRSCEEIRDRHHELAKYYSSFFSFLVDQYVGFFPDYFQEIYDAEMQDVALVAYEDSPAGFRLVAKRGRSDAFLWTPIYTEEQWIESLVEFFQTVEPHLISSAPFEEGRKDIAAITTAILTHLRSKEFYFSALERMAKAHQVSISSGRIEKKPWAYTSGGTMETLVKTYFRREGRLAEESRWVESPTELLIFFLDALKTLPSSILDHYEKDSSRGMLAFSPTHAFLLQPGREFFKEGWKDEGFTYTWVRDRLVLPAQEFYARISLNEEEQRFLVEEFSKGMHPLDAHQLRKHHRSIEGKISVRTFRETFAQLPQEMLDRFDGMLYSSLPLTPGREWKERVRFLLKEEWGTKEEKVLKEFTDYPADFVTSSELQQAALRCYATARKSYRTSSDLSLKILQRARGAGLAVPSPLIFGDSNWANAYFAFTINPGMADLQLWITNNRGSMGVPLSSWKMWMDGSKKIPWGVYVRPSEYQS